jgi:hypothetical protein
MLYAFDKIYRTCKFVHALKEILILEEISDYFEFKIFVLLFY